MKWFGVNKGSKYANGRQYLYYELYDADTGKMFYSWDDLDGAKSTDEHQSIQRELRELCFSITDFDTRYSYNRIISLFRNNKLSELGI